MVSVGMSVSLAKFVHAAHTNGNEKPTPTPAEDGRGNDIIKADKPRGKPHDRIYEHVHLPRIDSDDLYSHFGSLRELRFMPPKDIYIDSDIPRPNSEDNGLENQAEIFDPATQTWQPA
jgi:hypothetical protein